MLIIIFAKEPRALDAIQEENACKMLGYKETMKEHVVISGEIISNEITCDKCDKTSSLLVTNFSKRLRVEMIKRHRLLHRFDFWTMRVEMSTLWRSNEWEPGFNAKS